MNPYEILSIPKGASDEEIDLAFNVLEQEYADDIEKKLEINMAYKLLKDPDVRQEAEKICRDPFERENISIISNSNNRTSYREVHYHTNNYSQSHTHRHEHKHEHEHNYFGGSSDYGHAGFVIFMVVFGGLMVLFSF
jgi:curved DNA-binding protein CbpA